MKVDCIRPYLVQKEDRCNFHFVRGMAKRQRFIRTTHTTVKQFCTRSLLKFRSLVEKFHQGGRRPPNFFLHGYDFTEFLAPKNGWVPHGNGQINLFSLPTATHDSAIM